MNLEGQELWDHVEKLARIKYKKDDAWKLRMVDLLSDNSSASIRMADGTHMMYGMIDFKSTESPSHGVTEAEAFGNDCRNGQC